MLRYTTRSVRRASGLVLVGNPEVMMEVATGPVYDVGGVVKSFFHTTETNLQRDELRLAKSVIGRSACFVFLRIPLRVSTKARLLESYVQLLPPTMYSIFNH
jgi:hypothetical protein